MLWFERFDNEASRLTPDTVILKEEPLSRHCSFRIGGPARRMAFPAAPEELTLLAELGEACGGRPLILGNGTNVLFPDEGLDRLVINTRDLCRIEREEETLLRAGAGASLARVAVFAQQNGLAGLEFAHGIPGSVGGAVCMNAGAYGGEMKDVLTGASVYFPGEGVRWLRVEELDLGHRHSLLLDRPEAIVLDAAFRLQEGDPALIREKMDDLMQRRKASQPLEYPSAGSTFKRPVGYFAGRLIQDAGLKGLTVGGAQVSVKHAGFVINTGGATCADVLELIGLIQQAVRDTAGVDLEPEVRIIT